ncbi:transcriptional regulator with XRE-family HTH domain [Neorhizobium sp. 2083]|uniref:helix-turn-helix domain-containing protein n=1 Tax=Neorhizobium sp. 2083 TaxID=2817762 RepID=UPI0013AEC113|nr:helix-turn-helix transcriptional regulator [Neorhizobium sp. 2083]MDR6815094.1 transcriptional regulator with XRE-family HTH domain [Neorhizobium sp. 2083]
MQSVLPRREFARRRKQLKLTQKELASELDLPLDELRKLETGDQPVRRLHLLALDQLRLGAAIRDSTLVTAAMLLNAEQLLESVGYRISRSQEAGGDWSPD